MARTSVTFTGGGSGSRSKSYRSRRKSKHKKLMTKRSTITAAVKRALLNSTTSGLLGIEKKFHDVMWGGALQYNDPTSATYPATAFAEDNGTIRNLFNINRGSGPSERIGDKCTIVSLYCKGHVVFPGWNNVDIGGLFAGNIRNQHVFIALVQDKQTNGARFTVNDVYTKLVAQNTAGPLRNMANTSRFRVLKTWDYYRNLDALLQPAGGASDAPDIVKKFEWSMKVNIPLQYTNATTTGHIADLMDNSLHLIAFYDDNAWIAAPSLHYCLRARYTG